MFKVMKIVFLILIFLSLSVETFLLRGCNPSSTAEQFPEIIAAAKEGNVELVRNLIEKGADINERSKTGGTAIFYAAGNDHADVLEELLKNGADVAAIDHEGRSAIFAAASNGHTSLAPLEVLSRYKADINLKDKYGKNALFLAVDPGGSLAKAEYLINEGVDINLQSLEDQDFPLRIAVSWGDQKLVLFMLQNAADPNLQTKDGRTALMEACQRKDPEMVSLLLRFRADKELKDMQGRKAQDLLPKEGL